MEKFEFYVLFQGCKNKPFDPEPAGNPPVKFDPENEEQVV